MTEAINSDTQEVNLTQEAINYIKDRVAKNDYEMSDFHSWFTSQPYYIEIQKKFKDEECFHEFYQNISISLVDNEIDLFIKLYENKAGFFKEYHPFANVFFQFQDIGLKFLTQTKHYFSEECKSWHKDHIDGVDNYINQIMETESPKSAQLLSLVAPHNKIHKIRAKLMEMYLEDSELDGFTEAFTAIAEREKESTQQKPAFYITYSVDLHYGRIYSNYIKTEQEMAEWFSANFDVGFKGFSIGEIDGFKYLKSKETDKLFYFKYENSYLINKCLEELNSHYLKYENGAEDTTRYSIAPIFENDQGKTLFSFK